MERNERLRYGRTFSFSRWKVGVHRSDKQLHRLADQKSETLPPRGVEKEGEETP